MARSESHHLLGLYQKKEFSMDTLRVLGGAIIAVKVNVFLKRLKNKKETKNHPLIAQGAAASLPSVSRCSDGTF